MDRKANRTHLAFSLVAALALSGCNQGTGGKASTPAAAEPQTKTVGGLTLYYGVAKGATVKQHAAAHPEASMHQGPPASPAANHFVLALFDAKSNKRVTAADVAMRLGPSSKPSSAWLPMEAMRQADAETFGRYVELPSPGRYLVEFKIDGVGKPKPITALFAFERPE